MLSLFFKSNLWRASALLFFSVFIFTPAVVTAEIYRDTSTNMITANIDITKYAGKYYEIARYPFKWEKDCTAVTATYKVINANKISVVNTCNKFSPQGEFVQYEGEGRIVGEGKLKVSFVKIPLIKNLASGDYWILYVSDDYNVSVVGAPNGKTGWILSKSLNISKADLNKALNALKENGYDISKLHYTKH